MCLIWIRLITAVKAYNVSTALPSLLAWWKAWVVAHKKESGIKKTIFKGSRKTWYITFPESTKIPIRPICTFPETNMPPDISMRGLQGNWSVWGRGVPDLRVPEVHLVYITSSFRDPRLVHFSLLLDTLGVFSPLKTKIATERRGLWTFLLLSSCPVSYTHLDVYKRQIRNTFTLST